MGQWTEAIFANLAENTREYFEEVGREQVELIKQDISIPVVRKGRIVIRSKPGEPPRRDSGKLYNSIKSRTYMLGPRRVTLQVICTDKKGVWLEKRFRRPFMSTARQRLVEVIPRGILRKSN